MKKLLLILFITTTCQAVSEKLLDAIEQVESGGNHKAVGDGNKAVGAYQLHKIYVDEANRIKGRQIFTYADRLDRNKSREITRTVLNYYQTKHGLTDIQVSRCHNAGEFGFKKKCTLQYMKKIERAMR